MQKFECSDLIGCLEKILNINTEHYKTDFEYDRKILYEAAASDNRQDKTFIWLTRAHGTHCFNERDLFIKDTPSYTTLQYWKGNASENIKAYAVEVETVKNGKLCGSIYDLDYEQYADMVKNNAINGAAKTVTYDRGQCTYSFDKNVLGVPHPKYGNIQKVKYLPADSEMLKNILLSEKAIRHKCRCADIDKHISNLTKKPSVKKQLAAAKIQGVQKLQTKSKKKEDISL